MNEQAFSTLEYDALRDLLGRGAQTPMGRVKVNALAPLDDLQDLKRQLNSVGEAIGLRDRGLSWSFHDLIDPSEALALLRIEGAPLGPIPLLELARLCDQALSVRAVIKGESDACPLLWEMIEDLPRELHSIAARITNKILPGGELDDRASPELARIRHDIARLRSQITRSLESLMRKSEAAIQDELVTIRNDRFVIPVKADHRARVNGVAHGFSSSGATVFVEPLETIESNNELQSLRESEEREIARILYALTEDLRNELPALETATHAIAELDFIGAKASFARSFNCVVPTIDETGTLELLEARHPLLEENLRASGRSVVPVTFTLDREHPVMVISGANAGGKTVVLKTAGLISLMALSGLPVPSRAARIPFYTSVLADIGDHQSLAANLSTFTSHVANIGHMIKLCSAPALVLLDEVGTGTDPEEGSALGVAVVDHFRRKCSAQVMATTHYSGLKIYAGNEESVLNASVEFDEKTLQPTYRLILGIAGASSGLEIARRFGIPNEVIDVASDQVSDSTRDATEYLQRIRRETDEAVALRQALEEERNAVAEKYVALDDDFRRRDLKRQREFEAELIDTINLFEKRSKEIVANIEDKIERTKIERDLQKRAAELKREASSVARKAPVNSASRKVRVVRDGEVIDTDTRPAIPSEVETTQFVQAPTRPLRKGDTVRLKSFGTVGVVESLGSDDVEVRVKSLRFREKPDNLVLLEATKAVPESGREARLRSLAQKRGTEVNLRLDTSDRRAELNLIGRTTDEAVDETDKFLDQAFLNSFRHVRIIHGHGTGALRRVIGDLLKGHPHVERYSQAPQDQGGAGATVVELKG